MAANVTKDQLDYRSDERGKDDNQRLANHNKLKNDETLIYPLAINERVCHVIILVDMVNLLLCQFLPFLFWNRFPRFDIIAIFHWL